MQVATVVRQRLQDLRLSQQQLAAALKVTESYVSQLLTSKKSPPAPERTDLYGKLEKFLNLPAGQLATLAEAQHREDLKRTLQESPAPLYGEVRELILKKCKPGKAKSFRRVFEMHPFGDLERLVTQKLLDVAKKVAQEELASENWLKNVARLSGRKHEEMRVAVLEFLDTDVLRISPSQCVSFLDPLIDSWDIDLNSFGMDILLNRRLTTESRLRLEFVRNDGAVRGREEPGFTQFLNNAALSDGAAEHELDFLRNLRFAGRRPTALYYYRELQNLRDPLNFFAEATSSKAPRVIWKSRYASVAPMHKRREAQGLYRQLNLETRKAAIHRWDAAANSDRKPVTARQRKRRKRV